MKLLIRLLAASSATVAIAAAFPAQGRVHTVDDGKPDCGAVWHLDVSAGGSVQEPLEITDGSNGFENALNDGDAFGRSVATIGDLDGNGTTDLAVGTRGETVWILFREADGSVASWHAIRSGDFPATSLAHFGNALAFLGDLDGNGRPELAVGAPDSAEGGAFWILSLDSDGSVAHSTLVTEGQGGFGGDLDYNDDLGESLAAIGDLDGDGVPDLAAGAPNDDDGGAYSGALWILFLNPDATVKADLKISRTSGGFGSGGLDSDRMGTSVCPLGDLDDDGVVDLALGAALNGRGVDRGGVWILFLNAGGTVRAKQLITSASVGLLGPNNWGFGYAVAPFDDLDDDGIEDVAVGAPSANARLGAVFVLFMNADGTVKAQTRLESSIVGLQRFDHLGWSLAALGDVDGDGRADLAVGAEGRDGINDADFTDLQTAVNAAANGDTLLVSPGNYESPTVSAKSLTILADGAGTVQLSVRVEDLAASQTVALTRLEGSISLADNAGLVWINECRTDWGQLRANNCNRVVLVRSSYEGGGGIFGSPNMPPVAPAGVDVSGNSTLHAYDCTFIGAIGAVDWNSWDETGYAQQSGPGLSVSVGSFVFLSRCTVKGGDGFAHTIGWGGVCSDGGVGLLNAGEAIVLDSQLRGGTGPCANGPGVIGPVQVLAGEGLSFTINELGHEREDVTLTFQGPPFRPVYLGGSPMPHATFFPALRGSLLLGVPRATKFMGLTDSTGRLEVVHSIGLLPPSSDIRRVYLQPICFAGAPTLGAGALYVILDERF